MRTFDTELRRLRRTSASLSAATALAALLSFLFVVVVARAGGPDARGELAFLVALPTLLSFAATLGMEVANLFHAGAVTVRSSLVSASIVVGTVSGSAFAAAGWLTLYLIPGWLPGSIPTYLTTWAMLTVPLITVQFLLSSLLVGGGRERSANLIRIAMPLISVVTFAALATTGVSPSTAAVGSWIIGQVAGAMGAIVLSIRAFGIVTPTHLLLPFGDLFRYGLPAHGGNLADVATFRLDSLILAATAGAGDLGIYAAAINLAEVLLYIPSSVAMVLLPASAASDDPFPLALRATLAVAVISTFGAVLMIALAPWLIRLLFGPGFEGSVTLLRILSVAMIGMGIRRVLAAELAARRRQAVAAWIAFLTLGVMVTLDLALIPRFGADGAAWASFVAYLLGAGVIIIMFLRIGRRLTRPPAP